jgi:hypothetical protein
MLNVLLLIAFFVTSVGIALAIREGRRAPVRLASSLYGIDPDPSRPWAAMLISRGRH